MKPAKILAIALASAICCGCAEQPTGRLVDDATISTPPHPWPSPAKTTNQSPRILALWMNETTIPSGSDWVGRAVTTTNVASLEIRTESFSFVAQRTAFGDFRFQQHVLDMVPYYKRRYELDVIARNSAGDRDEWLVPIQFR